MANKRRRYETVNVSQHEIELFFGSDYCFADTSTLKTFRLLILDVIRTFFGVNGANVDQSLIDSITVKIKAKYPSITFSQLRHVFISQTVEKKEFVSITVDEFMKYIRFWDKREKQIKRALADLDEVEREKEIERQQILNFENSCRDVFEKSVQAKKWLGDKYQAKWVLSNMEITTKIPKEVKDRFWSDALEMAKKQIRYEESSYLKFVEPNYVKRVKVRREYIYAEMLINKILK